MRTPATARKATAAKTTAAKVTGVKPAPAAPADPPAAPKTPAAKTTAARKTTADPVTGATLLELPLTDIDESPDNPRGLLPDLPGLAQSIKAHGVIEPIVVVAAEGGRYRVVAGHRRLAAAALAGLRTIPSIVRDADQVTEMVERMIENLQRVDLTPIEEARGYQRLKDLGVKQKAIAEAVGRNQGHVSKRLTLLSLPESLQVRVGRDDAGGITLEQAVEVGRLPGRQQIRVAELTHADVDAKFRGGYDFDQTVRQVATAARNAADVVEVVKELRAAKVTILNVDGDEFTPAPTYSAADGPAPLTWLRNVDVDKHTKLECHAVVVRQAPYGGPADTLRERWTTPVCTDPDSHRTTGEVADDGDRPAGAAAALPPDPEREARIARDQMLTDLAGTRATFMGTLLGGKSPKGADAHLVAGAVRDALVGIEHYDGAAIRNAAQLLALPADTDPIRDAAAALTGTPADRARWALAIRLALDEDWTIAALRPGGDAADRVVAKAHLEFLEAAGYQLADPERDLVFDPAITLDAALVDLNLIEEDDPDAEAKAALEANGHDLLTERGVLSEALSAAVIAGVPRSVWLRPGVKTPTGRCSACSGLAPARASGPGKHKTPAGDVCTGGGHLMTIPEVDAADAPEPVEPTVACPDCQAVGRDADDTLCTRCSGSGLVPATSVEPVAAAG